MRAAGSPSASDCRSPAALVVEVMYRRKLVSAASHTVGVDRDSRTRRGLLLQVTDTLSRGRDQEQEGAAPIVTVEHV